MASRIGLTCRLLSIHLLLNLSHLSLVLKVSDSSNADLSALLSFKSQISADPLGVLSSWNESFHHCQWQGVLCGRHHSDRVIALALDSKQLSGHISPFLANLTFLRRIDLSINQLRGSIPVELGSLDKLQFLNLTLNFFQGRIPSTLGNCSNLEVIFLRNNNLHGIIPSNLSRCKELKMINLRNNYLTGGIPPEFGLIPQLQMLELSTNYLTGSIPEALGNLQNFQSFGIYANFISGEIPRSLYNISSLSILFLGNNQLEGNLPYDMCDAFSNLQYLLLYENQLKGQIPLSISNCSALSYLGLDSNHFSGTIPSTLGILKNLYHLLIRENQLEAKRPDDWNFINALANCTSLQSVDIAYNKLKGLFPSSITNISSISYLDLSNNPIKGVVPAELRKLTNLDTLKLDHMLLSGTVSEGIGNLFRLRWLDMSSNILSSQIPPTIGNLTKMTKLFLNDNAFEGSIPPELGNMQVIEILDLSKNKLMGNIPKEILSLTSLTISLNLSHNFLTNILPLEIGNLKNLQSISLSDNKLFGELPNTIGGCQELQALYLDNNFFQGTIPYTLRNIRGLQILDVSINSFSGQVPEFIGRMNLQYLNISFNNFDGYLPTEGILGNVSGLDVRGNPKLCGGISEMHLPSCISQSRTQSHHSSTNIVLISSTVSPFVCLTIVVLLLVACYARTKPHNKEKSDTAMKHELKHVSYNELLRATENFSPANLIGRGKFGVVYKAVMSFENMTTVAVKVLNLEVHSASRCFFSECEVLRNVRHRNLIKVLSSCSSIDHQGNDFKALVFEFMPNGSLAALLHPNADLPFRSLNLIQRLNIAIDVASALDYLHYYGSTPIIHCDLKPSNVLLDDDMTAHVSDFGLAKFLIQPDTILSQSMTSTSTSGIKGSIGYIPPEYGMGGRPSVEGDVYSYGILLLEMFTGVSPTDERLDDDLSLHKHVEMAFSTLVMDMANNELFLKMKEVDNMYALENVHSCLASVIRCGLLCSKESPKERISIKDVAKELNSSQAKLLGLLRI